MNSLYKFFLDFLNFLNFAKPLTRYLKHNMVWTCQQRKRYIGKIYSAGKCGGVKEDRETREKLA